MSKISIRFSEEEDAILREQAETSGVSVSELIRHRLFPENLPGLPQLPATAGQVHELAQRVAVLSEAVGLLAAVGKAEPVPGAGGGLPVEKTERGPGDPSADCAGLMRALQEQNSRPFGLDLPFVQATLMAVFALARGSFTVYPEEWEPFKGEARRRAFAPSEAPCSAKS